MAADHVRPASADVRTSPNQSRGLGSRRYYYFFFLAPPAPGRDRRWVSQRVRSSPTP